MLNLSLMNPVSLDSGQLWTPNYNGINSYLKIPDWHPNLDGNGEHHWAFEAICQNRDPTAIEYIYDGRNEDNLFNDGYFIHTSTGKLDSPFASTFVNGVAETHVTDALPHTIKAEHTTKNHAQALRFIGIRNSFNYPYAGQIHSIHIMDFNDPSNSRFYESIIRSKEMPTSNFILNELDGSNSLAIKDTSDWVDEGGGWYRSTYDGDTGSSLSRITFAGELGHENVQYLIEFESISGSKSLGFVSGEGGGFVHMKDGVNLVSVGTTSDAIWLRSTNGQHDYRIRIVSVKQDGTDGQLINFGTEQPWVALIR